MVKSLFFSFFFFFLISPLLSQAKPVSPLPPLIIASSNPQNNNNTNNLRSCSYTVRIKTSCSSPPYTRDQVNLAFGDAYGNQVYAPRLDDPSSRAFERCSTDTYRVPGPCTYAICYVYLMRSGYDGWMPESVTVVGYYGRVTFYLNYYLPNGEWVLVNRCNSVSEISAAAM